MHLCMMAHLTRKMQAASVALQFCSFNLLNELQRSKEIFLSSVAPGKKRASRCADSATTRGHRNCQAVVQAFWFRHAKNQERTRRSRRKKQGHGAIFVPSSVAFVTFVFALSSRAHGYRNSRFRRMQHESHCRSDQKRYS